MHGGGGTDQVTDYQLLNKGSVLCSYFISFGFRIPKVKASAQMRLQPGAMSCEVSVCMNELGHLSAICTAPSANRRPAFGTPRGWLTLISCGYSLFTDAASSSDYIASNGRNTLNNDQEHMRKEWLRNIMKKNSVRTARAGATIELQISGIPSSATTRHMRKYPHSACQSQQIPNRFTGAQRERMISQNTDHSVSRTR
jgi:hypothetical protein